MEERANDLSTLTSYFTHLHDKWQSSQDFWQFINEKSGWSQQKLSVVFPHPRSCLDVSSHSEISNIN